MINYEQRLDGRQLFVFISYYGENQNLIVEKLPIPDSERYNWMKCAPDHPARSTEYMSFDGYPVMKIKAHKFLHRLRLIEWINSQPKEKLDLYYSSNRPRKAFVDIETEIIDGFPDVNNPKERLLSYALCNEENHVTVSGLKPLSTTDLDYIKKGVNDYFEKHKVSDKFDINFIHYPSEDIMLKDFLIHQIPRYGMISGWNFLRFDWAFLMGRDKRILTNAAKVTSPTRGLNTTLIRDKFNKDPNGGTKVPIPIHRAVVDYMEIFQKWDTSIDVKESMSLDWVANEVLGASKLHYTGTLMQLYENNYREFILYNIIDTCLVRLIDKKLNTYNTMAKLAEEGRVQLLDSLFASKIIESHFSIEYLKMKKVLVVNEKPISRRYPGAYVKQPSTGIFYKIGGFDFQSEYPSSMMAFNFSPDTYLGILEPNEGDRVYKNVYKGEETVYVRGTIVEVDANYKMNVKWDDEITSIIYIQDLQYVTDPTGKSIIHKKRFITPENIVLETTKDHIYSVTGAIYDKTKDGVTKKMLENLFIKRVDIQKMADDITVEIEHLKKLKSEKYDKK